MTFSPAPKPRPRDKAPRKPLPKRNDERADRQFARAFHSEAYVDFVHAHDCAVPGCRRSDITCAHTGRTRRNGGRWFEIAPLCGGEYPGHHQEQEGRTAAFNEKYRIDLTAIAETLAFKWMAITKGPEQ